MEYTLYILVYSVYYCIILLNEIQNITNKQVYGVLFIILLRYIIEWNKQHTSIKLYYLRIVLVYAFMTLALRIMYHILY